MQNLIEYIRAEWQVLKSAPFTFIGLAAVCITFGIVVASWHYSGRIEERNGQVHRYRVALGIDKASAGSLVELTNEELKAKAANTVSKLREICLSYDRRSEEVTRQLQAKKIDDKAARDRQQALMTEGSNEYDRDLRSDFIILTNELLKRLDRKAAAGVVRVPLFDAETGTPVGLPALIPSGTVMAVNFLCPMADETEQLSKLLPPSEKH